LLTGIFPALERCFDYSARSPLILLAEFCTPAGIRQAGAADLADCLRRAGAWRAGIPGMVGKAPAAAAAQSVQLPGEATTAALISRLASRLPALHREIKNLDRRLASRFRTHQQAEIIESLPGMGPILGAEFIIATGGDLAAFGTSARLAAYAGLAPVPNDSGRRTGNLHRPTRYDRRLRRVFYLAAFSSRKTEGPSRVFYQPKRGERRRHTQALIALARRLVDVLWALLRDNRPFQPSAPARAAAA
jgi:transposase